MRQIHIKTQVGSLKSHPFGVPAKEHLGLSSIILEPLGIPVYDQAVIADETNDGFMLIGTNPGEFEYISYHPKDKKTKRGIRRRAIK
jgi:hypothetical protein